jgi:hypothetical protein
MAGSLLTRSMLAYGAFAARSSWGSRRRDAMSETEEQICVPCAAIRKEVFAEPVGRGYELRRLVCPRCKARSSSLCP